ncbi:MAG: 30S ribosomal protein S18 [Ktedonobacteraceae bacterium]|nr:30S ribosomal protein S18 [Ktedonobacteraceae bacterium]MBO0792583.1 30S ribosomal protein S18 [Ktedonobacteraceae bacterium]
MQRRSETTSPGATGTAPSSPAPRRERREGGRDRSSRRKICQFCHEHMREIDYKDVNRFMKRFISDRGKIEPRRKTGTCAKHQRGLSTAIKQARFMAMLPYTAEHMRGM